MLILHKYNPLYISSCRVITYCLWDHNDHKFFTWVHTRTFKPDVSFHWDDWLSRNFFFFLGDRCVRRYKLPLPLPSRSSSSGKPWRHFRHGAPLFLLLFNDPSVDTRRRFRGRRGTSLGIFSALLVVRRRRKRPAAIVWNRFNKRRCHPMLVPWSGCLRSTLTLLLRLDAPMSTYTSYIPKYSDNGHKTMNGSRFFCTILSIVSMSRHQSSKYFIAIRFPKRRWYNNYLLDLKDFTLILFFFNLNIYSKFDKFNFYRKTNNITCLSFWETLHRYIKFYIINK